MNDMSQLPAWDLTDLYKGTSDPKIEADFKSCDAEADTLRTALKDRVADADGDALAQGIADYETIQDRIYRLMAFSFLNYATDMSDGERTRFFQKVQERVNRITAKLLFFTLEINHLEEAALQAKLKGSAKLRHYGPWLRELRTMKDHVLSDELERLFHEKSITGASAWTRLFDQTISGLVFTVDGKEMPSQDALNLLQHRDRATRETAAKEISRVLGDNIKLFSLIMNTLIRDKQTEDEWRKIEKPEYGRHLLNQVEPEVVNALRDAVFDSFPRLSHRYYKMKAKWLGLEKMQHHDRNAPLPDNDDAQIPWDTAVDTVLNAYGSFSGELQTVAKNFFDKPWIDAAPKAGKSPGAFAHPVTPSAHPYLLMNYQGKVRDVMTLAHELGHGCHQMLAAKQGALMSSTPLTLAETASVFGEMLTFQSMLASAENPNRRRIMLASKVEDMINTVVRQTAFYEFELRLHRKRRDGELAPEEIGQIWLDVQRESLGPAFEFGDDYGCYWSYINHFVHVPFYVYAYAFGDCLVNALYQTYQEQPDGFAEKYLEMLAAGGTLHHSELLKPFGLNAADPAFWQRGLTLIEGFIDELEAM
ncbi:MAG: M3 family oligoendopeptidase [Minwuia sp.]|uniref:M3 family oligoendopeptidase n=1 Tax=Minwuia sp. TaxID=2493630 RepID=UPI003A85AA68